MQENNRLLNIKEFYVFNRVNGSWAARKKRAFFYPNWSKKYAFTYCKYRQ